MATYNPSLPRPIAGKAPLPSAPLSLLARIVVLVLEWQDRIRSRHHLAGMDGRMLRDVGLTREAVSREVDKPFWHG